MLSEVLCMLLHQTETKIYDFMVLLHKHPLSLFLKYVENKGVFCFLRQVLLGTGWPHREFYGNPLKIITL